MSARAEPARRPVALIVDDDPSIRLHCGLNLRLDGFDVLEAEDGRRALERARSELPDVVLSDCFGLAAALRRDERTRAIPVVFLSGETATAELVQSAA